MHYLEFIFLLSLICSVFCNKIYIDPVNGVDTEDCLEENGTCKTIKYTFENALVNYTIFLSNGNYGENEGVQTNGSTNISVLGNGRSTQINFSNGTLQTLFLFECAENILLSNFSLLNVTYDFVSFYNCSVLSLSSIWFLKDSFPGSFQTPFSFIFSKNITFNFMESVYLAETVYIYIFYFIF